MATPRVFLARHGETEWTINGRHTGTTEIPLTPRGESQVLASSRSLIGAGRLIDPSRLSHVFVSPRIRAQRTFALLLPSGTAPEGVTVTTEPALAEWAYGRYEGMFPAQIRQDRKARGLDTEREFDIWRDGCEDGEDGSKGESAAEVTARLDELVARIKALQGPYMRGGKRDVDVLLVSHGHLLRAFTKRWLGLELDFPIQMILEPGGIATLTYNHYNVDEPAFLLGGVFKDPEAEAEAARALK